MRVILNIPEENLEKLETIAKENLRSRKNFMEKILIEYCHPKNVQESQNKPHIEEKKFEMTETMPEGLNWKEQLEWTRNYKQNLKNQKT